MMSEEEWYLLHKCNHAHCPCNCEHPQPFMFDNKLVCGRCFFKYDEVYEMIPCTPETCNEDEGS